MRPLLAVAGAVLLALAATVGPVPAASGGLGPARAAADVGEVREGELSARVDEAVRQQMAQYDLPGLAVVVVVDREVAHAAGYGLTGADGSPVTTSTPFVLGSTSKQLTGLLVQDLVLEGELDLDTTVHSVLPWFGDGQDARSRITVGHLLGHTAGYAWDHPSVDGDPDTRSLAGMARRIGTLPLTHEPGSTFDYTNVPYDLLGRVVEVVGGQSYEDALQSRLAGPLGMGSTTTDHEAARAAGLAQGHYRWFGLFSRPAQEPMLGWSAPSATTVSTADDLTALVLAHLDDPAAPAGLAPVLDAAAEPISSVNDDVSYASGWFVHPFWASAAEDVDDPALPTAWTHDGGIPTYRSQLVFVPETGFGLAMTTNGGDVVRDHEWGGVVETVARAALDLQPKPAWTSGDPIRDNATGVMLGIPLLQLLTMIALVAGRGRRWWRAALGAAALVHGAALLLTLVYVPSQYGAPLLVQLRVAPDLAVVTGAAVLLAVAATAVAVSGLRRPLEQRSPAPTAASGATPR